MIIKLLEQPIIAINEAEIAGTVDGIVIRENKVSHIFHKNMESCFAIPVQNVIIGPDAVMIQEVSAMTMAPQSMKSLSSMLEVYNLEGKSLGSLTGVEVDRNYHIRYIYTDEYRIEMSKTVNFGSVLVVDVEESELQVNEAVQPLKPGYEADMEKLKEKVESSVDCNVVIPLKPVAAVIAGEQPKGYDTTETAVPAAAAEENAENDLQQNDQPVQKGDKVEIAGVDAKYAYLCGKALLEGIAIGDNYYEKDTIIDANLIRYAIDNNAIVTVIVNAEE